MYGTTKNTDCVYVILLGNTKNLPDISLCCQTQQSVLSLLHLTSRVWCTCYECHRESNIAHNRFADKTFIKPKYNFLPNQDTGCVCVELNIIALSIVS